MSLPAKRIGLIGHGAIGKALAARLAADPDAPQVIAILVRPGRGDGADAPLVDNVAALLDARPDLVVECAGQQAAAQFGPAILAAGIDLAVASVGALADPATERSLRQAAEAGGARLLVPAGAVAAIDGLAAARLAGLDSVTYTSRKPPLAWRGTAAESLVDLDALTQEAVLYEGTAREASRLFPKNANVATTVALAGIGFEATRCRIVADPHATGNCHEVDAAGAFGTLALRLENLPSPDNPKTSFLTVLSLERLVRNSAAALVI